MIGRVLTVGLVCFLFGAGAAMFFGPWLRPALDEDLPPCPYLERGGFADVPVPVVTAIGAYEAIRETLLRESLDGVAAQAEVIERAFAEIEPRIVSLAKRLGAEQDVESARRAFMRLHRLMQRHADKLPASTTPQ
ncbi:MAG: hypothetical protein WEC72_03560 [Chthoniobacterales bacterium]